MKTANENTKSDIYELFKEYNFYNISDFLKSLI